MDKTLDPKQLWTDAVDRIRPEVGEENVDLWLKPVEVLRLDNNVLWLKVPNRFYSDGIKERFLKKLEAALRELSGSDVSLDYEISKDLKNLLPATDPIAHPSAQLDFSLGELNPRYTFTSFVVGASNRFAHAAAEAIARTPGTQYNPFFIYGGVGLGKTHLMHAIGQAMRSQHTKARVLYTTSEQFVNEFVGAIQHNKINDFRAKYRSLDCLLIDDVQFLIGRERSEQEFFHTFNSLHDIRKQIVVTSDRSPKDMSPSEQRLISRFEWGVVADIKPPDLETRIVILRQKAIAEQIDVPDDVILFVASSVKSNIRALEGSLIRLKVYSSMTGSNLTVDNAKEILKDSLSHEVSPPISIDSILKVVAQKFQVDVRDLKGRQRETSVVLPRQVAMFLACTMTDMSFTEVGKHFGGKDHTTVMHAKKKIQRLLEQDLIFLERINNLRSEIKAVENA
ncbi:MAG: chromosomal replication initiator protein DnaA [Elusimicrobia bacterium]|nr:chromosomal replication initiator protein DnaA [Elusimicrobiota bacterium]